MSRRSAICSRLYLELEGFHVVEAGDGRRALYVAHVEKPDLVVLDLMMPEMGGYEFLRAFAKESRTPVIVLTAKIEDRIRSWGWNSARMIMSPNRSMCVN